MKPEHHLPNRFCFEFQCLHLNDLSVCDHDMCKNCFHAGDEGRLPEHLWLEDERRKLFLGMGSTSIHPICLEKNMSDKSGFRLVVWHCMGNQWVLTNYKKKMVSENRRG